MTNLLGLIWVDLILRLQRWQHSGVDDLGAPERPKRSQEATCEFSLLVVCGGCLTGTDLEVGRYPSQILSLYQYHTRISKRTPNFNSYLCGFSLFLYIYFLDFGASFCE